MLLHCRSINDERDFFIFFSSLCLDYKIIRKPNQNSISSPPLPVLGQFSFIYRLFVWETAKMKFLSPIAVVLSLVSSIAPVGVVAETSAAEVGRLRGEEVKYQGCEFHV